MDKKGEGNNGFVFIILAAVAILVGLALYNSDAFAGNIGKMTQISTAANVSFTLPANNTVADLTPCGQKNTSVVVIYSPDGGSILPAANYSVTQEAGTDGFLAARIKLLNVNTTWASHPANVSCSYQPKGYIDDGGSRAIVGLIAIFMALLIMISAMPNVREGIADFFNKR